MHPEAHAYVAGVVATLPAPDGRPLRVLEFGSRDVNGGVRDLFGDADYLGVDQTPGRGVDQVGDAAGFTGTGYDVVVCCEVLEHTPAAAEIITAAHRALTQGGRLILTCASTGRAAHSAVDGADLRPGEHYANVDAAELEAWLAHAGFTGIQLQEHHARGDLYAQAIA